MDLRKIINILTETQEEYDELSVIVALATDPVSALRNRVDSAYDRYLENTSDKNLKILKMILEQVLMTIDSITHGKFWENYHTHNEYENICEPYLELEQEIYDKFSDNLP